MKRVAGRLAVLTLLFVYVAGSNLVGAAEDSAHPNVIVILTDDQGWGDVSHHGNGNLETPHLDRLAQEGVSFDRFYVCPVCSPTRAEFLTGRYHGRCGVYSTSAGGERLNLGERTIAEHFKEAGYWTACYGKWHNGTQFPYHPLARGFDRYYGFCSGHWGHYYSPLIDDDGDITKGNGFLPDDLTDRLIQDISEKRDEPFFAYLPFNTPHSPMQVPDRWWNQFKDKDLEQKNREPQKEKIGHTRAALAMCENVDWNVGRILTALEETGQSDNTLIAYFCDNGPNGVRWNGGMKGRKGSTDEGGVRSPLFLHWPKGLKPGTVVKQNAAAIDLLPTLAGLAGLEPPTGDLDGEDVSSLVRGEPASGNDDRVIISHWRNRVSAKSGVYRRDDKGQFYDLQQDPEQRNPVDPSADVKTRMESAVAEYKAQVMPNYGKDDRPFIVGHEGHPVTQLPIRDAELKGTLKRSNRFPNSSFAEDWTKTSETVEWNVQLANSGRYRVDLFYTVAAKDAGSTLELSFQQAKLVGTVDQPVTPKLVGAEEDRVSRMESYEQEWGQMTLGEIDLQQGDGRFVLQATEIPGTEVMDLRLMTLTRVNPADSVKDSE